MDANLCRLSYVAESVFATNSIVRQSGTFTFTGQPVANQTVTIGTKVYTFRPNVPQLQAANDVLIGATFAATIRNLRDAIHANPDTAGASFHSGTVAHTLVYADLDPESDGKLLVYALIPGRAAGVAFASRVLTSNNTNVTAADTVTIDSKVYTFRAAAVAEGDVKIGLDADATLLNLIRAINHTGTPGTDYFCAAAHPTVAAGAAVSVHTITVTALTAGVEGNAIIVLAGAVTLSWASGTLTGGTSATIATTDTATNGSWAAVTLTGGLGTAPTFQELRFTGESLVPAKQTVRSEEIRSDRAIRELVMVGKSTAGSVNLEMLIGPQDPFVLAALMAAAWITEVDAITCSANADNTYTIESAAEWSAIVQGARYVKFEGFVNAANNGVKKIVSIVGVALTTDTGTLIFEESVAVNATVRYARNGVTFRSFKLLKEYLDNTPVASMLLNGQCLNQIDLNLDSKAIAKIVLGFMGADSASAGGTFGAAAAPTVPTDEPILNTSSNVGAISYTGVGGGIREIDAPVMKLALSLKNNLGERPRIGSLITSVPRKGTCEVTGQITTYFKNRQAIDDFLNHVSRSLEFALTDSDGGFLNVYIPRASFPTAQNLIGGINTDVSVPLDFQAVLEDADFMIQIDSLP